MERVCALFPGCRAETENNERASVLSTRPEIHLTLTPLDTLYHAQQLNRYPTFQLDSYVMLDLSVNITIESNRKAAQLLAPEGTPIAITINSVIATPLLLLQLQLQ